ncbi:MAG: gamma-glutamyltransferase, partial [Propioniciclava sp.]
HVQVVLDAVEGGDDPQTARGRPRWFWDAASGEVQVEASAGQQVVDALTARGHRVSVAPDATVFGRGQAIWRAGAGTWAVGSEPRADAFPVGW